jgi:DNA replication protein DnaC
LYWRGVRNHSQPARGRFFNLVDLVNQLEQEKTAGRSGRLAETLLRYDVIIID